MPGVICVNQEHLGTRKGVDSFVYNVCADCRDLEAVIKGEIDWSDVVD